MTSICSPMPEQYPAAMRFTLDPNLPWRAVVLSAAARLGLRVVHVSPTEFDVIVTSPEDAYMFGVESHKLPQDPDRTRLE